MMITHISPILLKTAAVPVIGKPRLVFLQPETFQFYREVRMYKTDITENQLKTIRLLGKPGIIKSLTALKAE